MFKPAMNIYVRHVCREAFGFSAAWAAISAPSAAFCSIARAIIGTRAKVPRCVICKPTFFYDPICDLLSCKRMFPLECRRWGGHQHKNYQKHRPSHGV